MTITDVCICFEIRSGREGYLHIHSPGSVRSQTGLQSAVVQLVDSVYTVAVGMSQIRTAVCHTDAN